MRLIDADALHKAYMELRNFKQDPQSGDWISLKAVPLTTVIRMLNDAPSIDIVRCRECKYWRAYETWSVCELWTGDPYEAATTKPDDFCSYGSRSEKPNNSERSSE